MKNFLIVLGFALMFLAGYFLSQKYNLKIENKNTNPTPTVQETSISPTEEIQISPTSQPTETDEELIKAAIIEKHGWDQDDVIITISQNDGEFARGGIKEKTAVSGGMFLAVKQNNKWMIVFEGNGVPDCTMLKTTYSFPSEILVGVCD